MTTSAPMALSEVEFSTEFNEAFQQYGMYDNARTIPDVRDGLKLGARRVLWSMMTQGAYTGKSMIKGAIAAGGAMIYHPHGDTALYDTIVTMAHPDESGKPIKMLMPLVLGQGSWGDLDFGAASSRYTECQINRYGLFLLGSFGQTQGEIFERAVPMEMNFANTHKEPLVLPAIVPNFVINGVNTAIGTGISSKSFSHNPVEALTLAVKLIESPTLLSGNMTDNRMETIRKIMPGPDFPCDAIIYDDGGVESYYLTGHGAITMRARTEVDEIKVGRKKHHSIRVTGFPFHVSPMKSMAGILTMIGNGRLPDHLEVINTTSATGPELTIEIGESDPQEILDALFYWGSQSQLQIRLSAFSQGIVDGKIKNVGTIEALGHWIDHRRSVVRNRSKFRIEKAKDRLEVVATYVKVIPIAEEIVKLIRSSAGRAEAAARLTAELGFTDRQSQIVLDMTLSSITKLNADKFEEERKELEETIEFLQDILSDPVKLDKLIIKEIKDTIKEIKRLAEPDYDLSERRCEIAGPTPVIERPEEQAPPAFPGVLATTPGGYVRWTKTRGINRIVGSEYVTAFEKIDNQQYLDAISNWGVQYRILCDELPEKMARVESMFPLDQGEQIIWSQVVANQYENRADEGRMILALTKDGGIKATDQDTFDKIRLDRKTNRGYKEVLRTDVTENPVVLAASLDPSTEHLGMLTAYGKFLRLDAETLSAKGRTAQPIAGIKLEPFENDRVVWMGPVNDKTLIAYWTDAGDIAHFRAGQVKESGRNTKGNSIVNSKNLISGAVAHQSGEGNVLRFFVPSENEPVSIELDRGKDDASMTDRRFKLAEKRLNKSASVWIDAVEQEAE